MRVSFSNNQIIIQYYFTLTLCHLGETEPKIKLFFSKKKTSIFTMNIKGEVSQKGSVYTFSILIYFHTVTIHFTSPGM